MNGRRVLDLACGNGRWLGRFRPGEYVGVDRNRAMLDEARRRYPSARFIQADMTRIPWPADAFDGVISMFGAMGHLPVDGQRAMVRQTWRVLRRGGLAIFTVGNLWSPFALPTTITRGRVRIKGVRLRVHSTTPNRLRGMCEGFEVLRLESYDHSYLPIMPLKFTACLLGKDYRPAYVHLMDLLAHCRHIPTMRWFGKQLLAVCRKT